jgi:hypothetical protein
MFTQPHLNIQDRVEGIIQINDLAAFVKEFFRNPIDIKSDIFHATLSIGLCIVLTLMSIIAQKHAQ